MGQNQGGISLSLNVLISWHLNSMLLLHHLSDISSYLYHDKFLSFGASKMQDLYNISMFHGSQSFYDKSEIKHNSWKWHPCECIMLTERLSVTYIDYSWRKVKTKCSYFPNILHRPTALSQQYQITLSLALLPEASFLFSPVTIFLLSGHEFRNLGCETLTINWMTWSVRIFCWMRWSLFPFCL